MRIYFVSDSIYPYNKGGKEKRLYELSTRLASMGHDVHICTMHWWKSLDKHRVENGVTLHSISRNYDMYSSNRRSIKQGLLFGLACFKLLGKKFDVIDVDHMPFFPIFSTWLVCVLMHKKLYATWHEALKRSDWIDYMGISGNVAALIERISIRLPYRITATSTQTAALIKSELKRSTKVSMVPSGVDIKLIAGVKPSKVHCDVLYVGRLVKNKNVDLLIRAVQIMSIKKTDVKCIIIGSGIEKLHLTKLISELNLSNNVRILDPLPTAEAIYSYMKAAKVFCLPSSREGFGIVALEALACGIPVVTVDSPANATKNLVRLFVNSSVVRIDEYDLAEKLYSWINLKKQLYTSSNILANYDWDMLATQQIKVYKL